MAPRNLLSLLLLATALPAPAQETETPGPAQVFRIKTRDAELVAKLAVMLGAEPPELSTENEVFHLALSADRQVRIDKWRAGMHEDTFAEAFIKPDECVKAYEGEIEVNRARWNLQANTTMQHLGYPAGFGEELIDQVVAVLRDTGSIYLKVTNSSKLPRRGLTVELDFVPRPDTPLHKFVRNLSPNFRNAPQIPADGSFATFHLSLNHDTIFSVLAPFTDLICRRGAKTDADAERARDYLDDCLSMCDGTFTARFDGETVATIMGLAKPEDYEKHVTSPDYLAWVAARSRANGVEIDFVPDAFEHRKINVFKSVATGPAHPLLTGDSVTTLRAVADSYDVAVAGADITTGDINKLLDRVLDDQINRLELDKSAFLKLEVDLREAMRVLPEEIRALMPTDTGVPGKLMFLMHKIGITAKCRLEIQ